MKFLKSRIFAYIIAVVAILGAFLLSARSGLREAVQKTEMLYYSGVKAEKGGYIRPSIESQMRMKYVSANNLLAVLDAHPEFSAEAEALKDARDYVYSNLGAYTDDTISGMSWANSAFNDAVTRLKPRLADADFTAREREIVETSLSDIAGAQNMIDQSGYNEAVREFNAAKMQRFPARLLLPLFGNDEGGAAYFN